MSDRTAHKEERLNEFPVTERETSGVYNCLECVFVYHNKRPQLVTEDTDSSVWTVGLRGRTAGQLTGTDGHRAWWSASRSQ